MRLNKYLAHATGISRREADLVIEAGRVTINGRVAKLGVQVAKEHDLVEIDGHPVEEGVYRYLLLNKPDGYLSSRKAQSAPTLYDLLPEKYHSLKTVGRLDKDTSGIILLTDDGDFAHQLTHPKFQKEKKYLVRLDKYLTEKGMEKLSRGIGLEDGISRLQVSPAKDGQYLISMSEGRNRQIRRTFEAAGYQVTALHRIRFGPYSESDLSGSMYAEVNKRTRA
ncbi:MAG: pseudouridine synthase [Candidatus Saccharimonadales bacterium]|nr:pseudouridine synthase [Candidatus Saccharimonadales bacterium]